MVTAAKAAESTKNGAVRARSRRVTVPLRQREIPSWTNGSMTTEVLASRARAYRRKDSTPSRRRPPSSYRAQAASEAKKKTAESTFLRSEIQATDSTATGWTAKRSPATAAPGTRNARRRRQRSREATAWSATFTAWKGPAASPKARDSTQNVVQVSGQ